MSDLNENKPASFDPSPNTEFLREKIKAKPINKKKLLRRTLFTVLTAAIFGAVACLTFLVLEPVISERVNSGGEEVDNPVETISFTDMGEDDTDEILPEDMYATDTEMIEEVLNGNVSEVNQNIQEIENMISMMEFGVEDYRKLYSKLRVLSDTVSYSLVNIIGIKESDFAEKAYDYQAYVSGVIVADNGPQLLVLVKDVGLSDADEIKAVFWDDSVAKCSVLGKDEATDLMILSISRNILSAKTLNYAKPVTLGTSRSNAIKGSPVIALGAPAGISKSIMYGTITSPAQDLHITDADYKYLYTDIAGSDNASGILVNLRGNVVGFIDNSFGEDTSVKAIGITELKPLIEKMSNLENKAYLGIQAIDITEEMKTVFGLPEGIYIEQVEMDSPAMEAGIQNGDIIVGIPGVGINNARDLIMWLEDAKPDSSVKLELLRQSVDNYVDIDITVTLGTVTYADKQE